jgi:hypothetical protein
MKLLKLKFGREYIVAMGDTIDCVPLINELQKIHGKIILPVLYHNYNTIRSFFDNDKVELRCLSSFNDYEVWEKEFETISVIGELDMTLEFDLDMKSVYRAAGFNYDELIHTNVFAERFKKFPQVVVPGKPFAFIPEGGSTKGFRIDRKYVGEDLEIIVPEHNVFMAAYAKTIYEAAEIHCHATGWQRLIDKLPTKGKLFMHHYARPVPGVPAERFPFLKHWTQLK